LKYEFGWCNLEKQSTQCIVELKGPEDIADLQDNESIEGK
jgi:hypothetical protein